MNILGILPFGYDPSACLIKDKKIIAMAEEERFIRIKHARNHFPINFLIALNSSCVNLSSLP